MAKRFVLDTSAIFTYSNQEDGFEVVEKILKTARQKKAEVFLSFVSLTELYYITWQKKGEDLAKEIVILVDSLPVEYVDSSQRISLSAGRIKAQHNLSVADAFVTATAIEKNAILVHKDPELKAVSKYVEILELPYKSAHN